MKSDEQVLETRKQSALSHILRVVASTSGKLMMYTTAMMGVAALFPAVQFPGVYGAIAAGIGINTISSIIERLAYGENVSDEEISKNIQDAILKSGIKNLLTKEDFLIAYEVLQSNQEILLMQNFEIINTLKKLEFDKSTLSQPIVVIQDLPSLELKIQYDELNKRYLELLDQIGRSANLPSDSDNTDVARQLVEQNKSLQKVLEQVNYLQKQLVNQTMDDEISQIKRQGKISHERNLRDDISGLFITGHSLRLGAYFADREDYLYAITRVLNTDTFNIISIIGRGGIGKTALVSTICSKLESGEFKLDGTAQILHGADGICVISCRDNDQLLIEQIFSGFGQILGHEKYLEIEKLFNQSGVSFRSKVLSLLKLLRDGIYLLIIDNLEEIVSSNSEIIQKELEEFIEIAALERHQLRIIITSRVSPVFSNLEVNLHIHTIQIDHGLPTEIGVEMLKQQEAVSGIDCGISKAEDGLLKRVVEAVSGIPKGIEYIYSILATNINLSIEQLANNEDIYEGEVLNNLTKLQFQHLTQDQKLAMMILSVFNRPVPAAAIQYIISMIQYDTNASLSLRSLARSNLVLTQRGDETYDLHSQDRRYAYRLINVYMGQFGLSVEDVHRMAAEYYSQIKKPVEYWKTLRDLEPNLLQIEQLMKAQMYEESASLMNEIDGEDLYLQLWGHYQLIINLRERLADALKDDDMLQKNNGSLGLVYIDVGRVTEAVAILKKAIKSASKINNKEAQSQWVGALGHAYWNLGIFSKSIQYRRKALKIAREIGNKRFEGLHLRNLGLVYRNKGNLRQAIKYYREAIEIARSINDKRGEGTSLNNLGIAYLSLASQYSTKSHPSRIIKKVDEFTSAAIKSYEEALEIAINMKDRRGEGIRSNNLGDMYLDKYLLSGSENDIRKAIRFHNQAYQLAKTSGHLRGLCNRTRMLSIDYLLANNLDKSKEYLDECLECSSQILQHSPLYEVQYIQAFALLLRAGLESSENQEVIDTYRNALVTSNDVGVLNDQIRFLDRLRKVFEIRSINQKKLEDVANLLKTELKNKNKVTQR